MQEHLNKRDYSLSDIDKELLNTNKDSGQTLRQTHSLLQTLQALPLPELKKSLADTF